MDYLQLSKVISHSLRHAPSEYGLVLDKEGFTSVESLISGLKSKSKLWNDLSDEDIFQMIESSHKKRHEIVGGQIRALYGHSVKGKIDKRNIVPPEFLYHATSIKWVASIKTDGLLPMKRQYVHLAENIEDAERVALRRTDKITLLKVKAKEAYNSGQQFFQEGVIWLSESIPSDYITFD